MTDISDPAGAGRGDRKRARKVVDAAYAAGRISAADRGLRAAQIDAASTRGDLAMVTRDLLTSGPSAPAPQAPAPAPAPDLPPASPDDPSGLPWPPVGLDAPRAQQANRNVVKWVVVGIAVVFLLPCLLGFIGLVVAGLTFGDDGWIEPAGPETNSAVRLAEWQTMVEEVRADNGDAVVSAATVEPDGYSIELPVDPAARVIDLDALSPFVVAELPDTAAEDLGVSAQDDWLIEIDPDGLDVTFPGEGTARYDLDGAPLD